MQTNTQTKEALTRALTQYRNLVEQSNDAIYLLYDNKFESVNAKFIEMFGYTLTECNQPDFHFMQLVADESKPIIEERMRKFAAGEPLPSVYEFSAVSKDGRVIKCEASVSKFQYKSGMATQGVIRDIGARKKAEEQSRKLLQAVEQSPVAILIMDMKGRIEYSNPHYLKMSGYDAHEIKGRKPFILQSDPEEDELVKKIWDTIADGNVWSGEIQNMRQDGQFYWEKIEICPIFRKKGLITNYLYVGEDVTERRELEEQLRQSQKMEAIGQLAGGVAHDFNNLLTIINGYSEILLSSIQPDNPFYNSVNQIKQAGLRAESLTRQLLAFSRKQIMQPKVLDLNDLVHNLENMLSRLIGENIDLITLFDSNLHRVKVDPGQFEQVVLNLAINARDAMPRGGTLTIETRNLLIDENHHLLNEGAKPGWYAMLTVRDTGKGIDGEVIERIFEPFYSTKGKGTGLGLSTVYGIVKQSGGIITVNSSPGRGAAFQVLFPAWHDSQAEEESSQTLAEPLKNHETILIAEDEDSVRELAKLALERVGFQVITAKDGEEAIEKLQSRNGEIDILLTDVIMPKIGGRALADAVQKKKPGLKVLFMSGYTDDAIVEHGVLEEGTHFIQKPFTPERLIRKIRSLLSKISK